MKHIYENKVYYSDTDAYGVVWHGSYLRWLEAARIEFCEALGSNMLELEKNDIVLPVAEIKIKYKNPAKINDKIIVETSIKEFSHVSFTFEQKIYKNDTNNLCVVAEVQVVAVTKEGKLYRKLPDVIANMLTK